MNIGNYIKLYSEDLRLKNYAKSSIENYCSQVALFLADHEKVATKPSEISERQIKEWIAGHANSKTTDLYLHLSHNLISKINSPINNIKI